jgi:hypothetical protein
MQRRMDAAGISWLCALKKRSCAHIRSSGRKPRQTALTLMKPRLSALLLRFPFRAGSVCFSLEEWLELITDDIPEQV